MKNTFLPLICSLALIAAAGARAQEAAKPAADPTTMIIDLRSNPPDIFQYGSWSGKLAVAKSGMVVLGNKGAQGDGGFGQKLSERLDLNQAEYFEVALGTIPGNEVPKITIAFDDIDGTQYTAQVDVDHLVPGSPVWLRVKRNDFKINPQYRGADSLMDWTKIQQWHLQGDWVTKKPMSVAFVALRERR
jgi:hypothetical protein